MAPSDGPRRAKSEASLATSYFSSSSVASEARSHASAATSVWEKEFGGKGYEWRKCFSSSGTLFFKHNNMPDSCIPPPDPTGKIANVRNKWKELNDITKPQMTTDYKDMCKPMPSVHDFPDLPPLQVQEQPKIGAIVVAKRMKKPSDFKPPPVWPGEPAMEPRVMSMTGALLQRYNTGTKLPRQEAMERLVAEKQRQEQELKAIYDPQMMSEYMHMTRNRSGQGMESDLTNKKRAAARRRAA
jgi:hypothetical protein